MGRPATGQTPLRAVRVSDEDWDSAQAVAKAHGETVSQVIRRALREYAASDGQRTMAPPRRPAA